MQLFYQSDIQNSTTTILNEEESRHCAQVLRLKVGQLIQITNGSGSLFSAELIEVNHKKCVIALINEEVFVKPENFSLHIAIAPTKNMDRMEWFVEKAVELGIDEITPIICARSERKEIKIERLKKVAISAMKQSLKFFLPIINEPISFQNFTRANNANQKFLCFSEAKSNENLNAYETNRAHNTILIGPEGDFTGDEIKNALDFGFLPINLGQSRLRTETAAIHAVSIINFKKSVELR